MSQPKGYIKLYRSIQFNKLWTSQRFTYSQAWIDLLLIANHAPGMIYKHGVEVEVKRGQVGHSMLALADRWQWSRGKVKRFLNRLETEQQIRQHNNPVTSLITIINYEKYQGYDTINETTNGQQTVQQTGQQTVQQTDINNKNKEEQRIKNKKNSPKSDHFDRLWTAYPSKIGKKEAARHYGATVKSEADESRIETALQNYLAHINLNSWKPYMNGSTWFNNWQDWENWQEPLAPEDREKQVAKRNKVERELLETNGKLEEIRVQYKKASSDEHLRDHPSTQRMKAEGLSLKKRAEELEAQLEGLK